MEEEYCDELAEEKEIKDSVLGAEGLDEDEELDGGEGKLGEDLEDGHLVAPAELVSTRPVLKIPLLEAKGQTKELLDVNRDEASPRHLYCRSYKRRANGAWISAEGYREGGGMEGP